MSLSVPEPVLGRRRGSLTPVLSLGTGPPLISVKCVIIGDTEIGKTCFLNSFVNPGQDVEKEYIPTVFDTFSVTKDLQNRAQIALSLYDTSGSDKNQIIRLDTYSQTDVFILAFAIDNIHSFDNVKKKWFKEIKHFGSVGANTNDIPVMLIGMKSDTRKETKRQTSQLRIADDEMNEVFEDPTMTPRTFRSRMFSAANKPMIYKKKKHMVSVSQGLVLATELGAACYMECSSSDKIGIENIFEEVIKLGISIYEKE